MPQGINGWVETHPYTALTQRVAIKRSTMCDGVPLPTRATTLGMWPAFIQRFLRAQGDAVRRRGDVEYWIGRLALSVMDFVVTVVVTLQKLFKGRS